MSLSDGFIKLGQSLERDKTLEAEQRAETEKQRAEDAERRAEAIQKELEELNIPISI